MAENQDQQRPDGTNAALSQNTHTTDGSIVVSGDNYGQIAGRDIINNSYEAEKIEPFQLTGDDGLGKLNNVPQLPPNFLPRPEMETPLKEQLLGKTKIVGVTGMGGMGKSVLAAQIVRDEEIRQRFCNGVLWVKLGQETTESDIVVRMGQLARELTGKPIEFKDKQDGQARLSELFSGVACLVVLDDVWKLEDATAFDGLGKQCCLLITTRNSGIIQKLQAQHQPLGLLSLEQSLALLSKVSGQAVETLPNAAQEVAEECGRLPLALSMAGALAEGDTSIWPDILQCLRDADLGELDQDLPGYEYFSLMRVMQVSVDQLEPQAKYCYLMFAIFPEDVAIPSAVVQMLWCSDGIKKLQVKKILDKLVGSSLLQRGDESRLMIHDLQLDYLRQQADDLPGLHQKLLDAYGAVCDDGWASGPKDGYFFEQLAWHLKHAKRLDELRNLLLDYDWLAAKLQHTGLNSLLSDYAWLPEDQTLRLIQSALRLSAHVLAEQPSQLTERLWGHLCNQSESEIQTLLDKAAAEKRDFWLKPRHANLTLVHTPILRPRVRIQAMDISHYGEFLVLGGWDNTVRIWDIAKETEIKVFSGHTASIKTVAISDDAKYVVSGSEDNTVRIWDISAEKELQKIVIDSWPTQYIRVGFRQGSQEILVNDQLYSFKNEDELWQQIDQSEIYNTIGFDKKFTFCISLDIEENNLKFYDLINGFEKNL